jgi:PAS domain S-box-containing protein
MLLFTIAVSIVASIEKSLVLKIESEKNTENQIQNYIDIVEFYQKNNFEKSIEYCNAAIEYCKQKNKPQKEIEFKLEKGKSLIFSGKYNETSTLILEIEQGLNKVDDDLLWGKYYLLKNLAFINLGEFAKAMDNGLKALVYFKKTNHVLGLAKTYNNIGSIYDVTNNSQKALENYLKSKDYAISINNKELVASLDNNIGIIYNKLNDNDRALQYYYKALEYNNQSGNLNSTALSFNNIATLLSKINRKEEAMAYYKKALTLNTQTKNIYDEALLHYNIGELLFQLNQYDSAEHYLNKSLKLYMNCNDLYSIAEVYILLGNLYLTQNKNNQAIKVLNIAIDMANKLEVLNLKESAYKLLGNLYAAQKNYKTAYNYQKKASLIADSILNVYKMEELKYSDFQIEFQSQSGKFEKDLKLHDNIHQVELQKERTEKYTYALLLVLIIIIAVILYRSFNRSSKINKTLVQKHREVEDQKELMEISNIELREQYSFTETLLNTIPNPVFYTDKNSLLLGCNKAFEEISGLPIDDIIGLKTSQLNFDFDVLCDSSKIKDETNDQLIRNEGILTFADDSLHDVICYRKGIIDPKHKLVGVLGIIIDITEVRETEKKLKYSQSRLQEAINSKDKFFNIMAHDLKNPFNAILGLTSFIADDFGSHTEAELKEYIGLINQSSTKIYNLLENLLEWARAQSGSIEKNPTKFIINEVIQECVTLFIHSCEQKNIALNINIFREFEVKADKNMIMAILRNLLSNAIKYTPHNGEIRIEANANNTELNLSVIDNGIGIPKQNIDRLFKIDRPVSTPGVDNERGTGLGLIICQEFVKQNGGIIHVTSSPEKGSNFTFTIPFE